MHFFYKYMFLLCASFKEVLYIIYLMASTNIILPKIVYTIKHKQRSWMIQPMMDSVLSDR